MKIHCDKNILFLLIPTIGMICGVYAAQTHVNDLFFSIGVAGTFLNFVVFVFMMTRL